MGNVLARPLWGGAAPLGLSGEPLGWMTMEGCEESVEWNTGITFDPQNSAQSPLK